MADFFGSLPDARLEPDAVARVRDWNRRGNRRLAVLDDDPTGSQSVHNVTVVTVPDRREYDAALDSPGATCFILTNTRSLAEPAAAKLANSAARDLLTLGRDEGFEVEIVSRSDSTLRGHVMAELRAIEAARQEIIGKGYDAIVFAPAFLEAGRVTAHDVHWARVEGKFVPVGETEFARDATFGYHAPNLKEFLVEKAMGALQPGEVQSVSLEDIRVGGAQRVATILQEAPTGAFVVINALEYSDLEIVALGLTQARDRGRAFLYRTGPSFVRALAGMGPRDPLKVADIWPGGHPGGHGLVVVGSHVGLTGRQVAFALAKGGLCGVELDVPKVIAGDERDHYVAETAARVATELAQGTVLLYTSRDLLRGRDAGSSLQIARDVSSAVVDVVTAAIKATPAWVIAKGGITSHDVAVRGLGIRRAEVLGQLFPGTVSVFRPVEAAPEAVGVPYVVFAGNVGNEETLGRAISIMSGNP
jgi:uncharacterized protein YgbK (DUF1537 family)